MSFAAALSTVILDTVLGRLAVLFLTGARGDLTLAHEAARQMLADYRPETNDELRLAAEIINFSFHALEALGQATTPEMTLNKILRLRGSAVSLSREAHKSRRKLDQLQREPPGRRRTATSGTTRSPTDRQRPRSDRGHAEGAAGHH